MTGLCHTPDCTKHRSERLNSLLNQLIIFRFLFFFFLFFVIWPQVCLEIDVEKCMNVCHAFSSDK